MQKYFPNIKAKNEKVKIYGNVEEAALDDPQIFADFKQEIQRGVTRENYRGGTLPNGKVFLIAGNIPSGEELGVLLHELGVHVGLSQALGVKNIHKIAGQILNIYRNGNERDRAVASRAIEQAENVLEGSVDNPQFNEELVAYFIEYAVSSGVYTPSVPENTSMVVDLMNRILQFIKDFVAKTLNTAQITPQQLVDMAWAMANNAIIENTTRSRKKKEPTVESGDLFEQKNELEADPPEIREIRANSLDDSLRNNSVRGITNEAHKIDVRIQTIRELENIAKLDEQIDPPEGVDENTFYNELDDERVSFATSWASSVTEEYYIPEVVVAAKNFLDSDSGYGEDYFFLAKQIQKFIQKQKDSYGYKDGEKLVDIIYGDQAPTIKKSLQQRDNVGNAIKTKDVDIINEYRKYLKRREESLEKAYEGLNRTDKFEVQLLNLLEIEQSKKLKDNKPDITDGQATMLGYIVRGALSEQKSVSSKFTLNSPALNQIAEAWFTNEFTFQTRGIELLQNFLYWYNNKSPYAAKEARQLELAFKRASGETDADNISDSFSDKLENLLSKVLEKEEEFYNDLGSVIVEQWARADVAENEVLDADSLLAILYNWVKARKNTNEKAKSDYYQAQALVEKYFIANPLEWNVKDTPKKLRLGNTNDFLTYGWDKSAPLITRAVLNNPYPRKGKLKDSQIEETGDFSDDMSLLAQHFVADYQNYITNTLRSVLGNDTLTLSTGDTTLEEIEGSDFYRNIEQNTAFDNIDDIDELSYLQDFIESQKTGTQMTTEKVSFKYDVITDITDMGVYAAQDGIYYTNPRSGERTTIFAGQLAESINYGAKDIVGRIWLNKSNILVTQKDGSRAKQDPAAHKNYSYDFANLPRQYLKGMHNKGIEVVETNMLTGIMLKDNVYRNKFGKEDPYWGWNNIDNRGKVLARHVPFWAMYYLQFPLPQGKMTTDGRPTAPDVEEVKKLLAQIDYKKETRTNASGNKYESLVFSPDNVKALTELGYLMARDSRFVSYVIDRTVFQDPLHFTAGDIKGPAGWSNESIKRARQTLNGNVTEIVNGRLLLKEEAIDEVKGSFNTGTLYSTLIFRGEGILKKSKKSNKERVEKNLTREEKRNSYFTEEGWVITKAFEMPVSIPSLVNATRKKRNDPYQQRDKEHPQDNSIASLVYEGVGNILGGTKVERSETNARWHTMLLPNEEGFLKTDGVFSMLLENGETIHLSAGIYRNAENFPFSNGFNEWLIEYNNPRSTMPSHAARRINHNGKIIIQRIPLADNIAPIEQEMLRDDVGQKSNSGYWREYFRALLFFTPKELEELNKLLGKKIDNAELLRNLRILLPKDTVIFESGGKARADGRMTWKEVIFNQFAKNKEFWANFGSRDASQHNERSRTIREAIYMMTDLYNEDTDFTDNDYLNFNNIPNIDELKNEQVNVVEYNKIPLDYKVSFPTLGQMQNFPTELLREAETEIWKAAGNIVDTNIKKLVEQKWSEDVFKYPLTSQSAYKYSFRNATNADYIDAIYALMIEKYFGNHKDMSLSDIAKQIVEKKVGEEFFNKQVPTFGQEVVYTDDETTKNTKGGFKQIWAYKPNIIQFGRLGIKASPFVNPAHILDNVISLPFGSAKKRANKYMMDANLPDIENKDIKENNETTYVYVVDTKTNKILSGDEFKKRFENGANGLEIRTRLRLEPRLFYDIRNWLIDNRENLINIVETNKEFENYKLSNPDDFALDSIKAGGNEKYRQEFLDLAVGGSLWSHELKKIAMLLGIGYQTASSIFKDNSYRDYESFLTKTENPKVWNPTTGEYEEWSGERGDTDPQFRQLEKEKNAPIAPAFEALDTKYWLKDEKGNKVISEDKRHVDEIYKRYNREKQLKELKEIKQKIREKSAELTNIPEKILSEEEKKEIKNLNQRKAYLQKYANNPANIDADVVFAREEINKIDDEIVKIKDGEDALELRKLMKTHRELLRSIYGPAKERIKNQKRYEEVLSEIEKFEKEYYAAGLFEKNRKDFNNAVETKFKDNVKILQKAKDLKNEYETLWSFLFTKKANIDDIYPTAKKHLEKGRKFEKMYLPKYNDKWIKDNRYIGSVYKNSATMRISEEGEIEAIQDEVERRAREWNNNKNSNRRKSNARAIINKQDYVSFEDLPVEDSYLKSNEYPKAKKFFDSIVNNSSYYEKEKFSFRFAQRIFDNKDFKSGEEFIRQGEFERQYNYLPKLFNHFTFKDFNYGESGNPREKVKTEKKTAIQTVADSMASTFRLLFKDEQTYKNWIRNKTNTLGLKRSGKNSYELTLSFKELQNLYGIFNNLIAKRPEDEITQNNEVILDSKRLDLEIALSKLYDAFLKAKNSSTNSKAIFEKYLQKEADNEFINASTQSTGPKRKREYIAESLSNTHVGKNAKGIGRERREVATDTIRTTEKRNVINIWSNFNYDKYQNKLRNVSNENDRLGASLSNKAPSPIVWAVNSQGSVGTWLDNERVYQAAKAGFVDGTDEINEKIAKNANNVLANPRDIVVIDSRKAYPLMVDINTEKFLQSVKWLQDLQKNDYFEDFEFKHDAGNANADFWEMGGHVAALRDAFARVKNRIEEWKKEGYDTTDTEFLKEKVFEHIEALKEDFFGELNNTRSLGDYHPPKLTAEQEKALNYRLANVEKVKTDAEIKRDFIEDLTKTPNEIRFQVPFVQSTDGAGFVFKRRAQGLIGNIYDEKTVAQLFTNPQAGIKVERDNRSNTGWALVIKNGETFKKIFEQMKNKDDFKNYPKVLQQKIDNLFKYFIRETTDNPPPNDRTNTKNQTEAINTTPIDKKALDTVNELKRITLNARKAYAKKYEKPTEAYNQTMEYAIYFPAKLESEKEFRDFDNPGWREQIYKLFAPLYDKEQTDRLINDTLEEQIELDGQIGDENMGVLVVKGDAFDWILNDIADNLDKPGMKELVNIIDSSIRNFSENIHWVPDTHYDIKKAIEKENFAEDFKNYNVHRDGGTNLIVQLQNRDVPFSKLNLKSSAPIEQQKREAVDYIQNVLGDDVGVVFKDSAWGEKKDVVGSFSKQDGKRLINLAMTGDVLSTAYHESFHAFLSTLHSKAPKHYEKLISLSRKYKDTTLEILGKMSPSAKESAMQDKEELAAYTYQLQMTGLMPANALSRKVCGKIQQMLYRIGGLFNQAWRNKANDNADVLDVETKLLGVYRKFNEGVMRTEFSQDAFFKQLNNDLAEKKHNETINKAVEFFSKWGDKLFNSADAVLRRPNIDELNELADLFYNDVVDRDLNHSLNGATGAQQGDFTLRIFSMRNRWVSMYSKIIADLTAEEKGKIRRALLMRDADQAERIVSADKRLLKGFKAIRNFMDQVYDDLVEKNISSRIVEDYVDPETGETRQAVRYEKWTKNTNNVKGNKYRRNYFPFVWDKSAIEENKDEFVSLLTAEIQDAVNKKLIKLEKDQTPESHAEYIADSLMGIKPIDIELGLLKESDFSEFIHGVPYGSATEKRYLGFILNRDKFDKFFEQDMDNVITDYVIRMSKRAVFQNIFGENGARIYGLLNAAENKLAQKNGLPTREELENSNNEEWVKEQSAKLDEMMRPYHRAVSAMCGMLGQDLAVDSPLRKINALGVTYQNIRLLTFSLFTSFQDVAGLFIHGGTMNDAWEGFCRGLKEIKNSWLKKASKDELAQMAADFGVVDPLSYIGSIGELNGTQYMTGKLRGLSNKFFRIVGLEGWNRGLKTQAMIVAERRIKSWKEKGVGDNKADKLLFKRCYGDISPSSIEFEGEHLKINDANIYAINRMVADMVMTPTSANRPAWASDPRFLLFAQLKTFTYTMHRVLLRGMLEQARLGNVKPAALAFASLFPLAAAGYMIKEMLLGMIDDDDDDWKWQSRNMVPYIFQRSGALGVPQMYLEDFLSGDWARMFGPTADQIQNVMSIPFAGMWNISQNHTPYKEFISATPMASLVKRLPYVYDS